MNLKSLIGIIIVIGVVILNIKVITDLFAKKKANRDKRTEINTKVQHTFIEHEKNIKDMQDKYDHLYSEFLSYKKEAEKSLEEIETYTDKIIDISNMIIAFDDDFEDKLNLWYDLLNNPNNSEAVKKQIKEHIIQDNKFKEEIKLEREQQKIKRQELKRLSFGLDR